MILELSDHDRRRIEAAVAAVAAAHGSGRLARHKLDVTVGDVRVRLVVVPNNIERLFNERKARATRNN